jgi:hypothetical protein
MHIADPAVAASNTIEQPAQKAGTIYARRTAHFASLTYNIIK